MELQFTWRRTNCKRASKRVSFPRDLLNHTSSLVSGRIYLFGGYISQHDGRVNWLYSLDYVRQQWKKLEAEGISPKARSSHTANVVKDSLWIIGGNDQEVFRDIHILDLVELHWQEITLKGDSFGAVQSHSSNFMEDRESIILFKGDGRSNVFEIKPEDWSCQKLMTRGPSPTARSAQSSCCLANKLYICGGYLSGENSCIYILTFPEMGNSCPVWSKTKDSGIVGSRARGSMITFRNKIVLFGGFGTYRDDELITSYDTEKDKWSKHNEDDGDVLGEIPPRVKVVLQTAVSKGDFLIIIGQRHMQDKNYFTLHIDVVK